MKKTYCRICGEEENTVPSKGYDTNTGKQNTKKICSNLKCPKGCEENGGHQWGEWSGFWFTSNRSRKCKRCGDEDWSGYY